MATWQFLGLVSVFIVVLLVTAWRGIDITCGCYGEAFDSGIGVALARNTLLIACAVILLVPIGKKP